ncbi:MAG: NAD(P)(+) transhydrogenase (Re/Si-specific) subunit alpha, partial [Gammaproteobacteria bacterium]|nr:NAD(P)(+) transhydrogenase (Re/Si-specific) subunit alpha [Gammaproteobacteria bacterium]
MKIGVPREIHPGEQRVATTPEVVKRLVKLGYEVGIESNAGAAADYTDEAYRTAGAVILPDPRTLWSQSDLVLKVRAPEHHPDLDVDEISLLREGSTLVSFIWPAQNPEL